jgi:hypothetical protein
MNRHKRKKLKIMEAIQVIRNGHTQKEEVKEVLEEKKEQIKEEVKVEEKPIVQATTKKKKLSAKEETLTQDPEQEA